MSDKVAKLLLDGERGWRDGLVWHLELGGGLTRGRKLAKRSSSGFIVAWRKTIPNSIDFQSHVFTQTFCRAHLHGPFLY